MTEFTPQGTPLEKFNRVFGKKPILAGVYADHNNSGKIVYEVHLLDALGVSGVYIENDKSLHDTTRFQSDVKTIESALEELSKLNLTIKVGVNIMTNRKGTEHVTAFALAEQYGLDFIAVDMIAGRYSIGNDEMELDARTYNFCRDKHPDLLIFGGLMPPYAKFIPSHYNEEPFDKPPLVAASERSDAIMVKARMDQKSIPLDMFTAYALESNLPLIAASKINKDNVATYAPLAHGFIIGSALRKDGELYVPTIREINQIVSEHR